MRNPTIRLASMVAEDDEFTREGGSEDMVCPIAKTRGHDSLGRELVDICHSQEPDTAKLRWFAWHPTT